MAVDIKALSLPLYKPFRLRRLGNKDAKFNVIPAMLISLNESAAGRVENGQLEKNRMYVRTHGTGDFTRMRLDTLCQGAMDVRLDAWKQILTRHN